MKKISAVFFMLLATNAVATDRLETAQVDGLYVPGTPALAKQQGFTNCSESYDKFECAHSGKLKFFGETAERATLSIDGKQNFSTSGGSSIAPKVSTVPTDQLSYRDIRIDFHLIEREALKEKLLADGWLKSGSMNNVEFVKHGTGAVIKFQRSGTTLSPRSVQEVNQQYADLKAKAADQEKSKSAATSFIENMKQ